MFFTEAVKSGFGGYVDFNGTSTRPEFLYFILFQFLAIIIASLLDMVLFGTPSFLYLAVALGLFLPSLAVGIRRLHDMGRSGWWCLIVFVPVGFIVLIVFWSTKSKMDGNIYR